MQTLKHKVPVTIITGFLGSGKTTLVNHLLSETHGEKIAVIVNEFGEVSIDTELIVTSNDQVIEMANGCICCTVRGDLYNTLIDLIEKKKSGVYHFDRIVIETTGLAEPGPIIQTFLAETSVESFFKIDGVITVIDGFHLEASLKESETVLEQIAFADVIILNKMNIIKDVTNVEQVIRKINPRAIIYKTTKSVITTENIFDIDAFALDQDLEIHDHDSHDHIGNISSLVIKRNTPISEEGLILWVNGALLTQAKSLLRYKGIVYTTNEKERIILQGVHNLFEIGKGKKWEEGEVKETKIVLIGKDLNKAHFEKTFDECASFLM